MTVEVNGDQLEVAEGASLADVVALLGVVARRGFAVAVNGEVVPRGQWTEVRLHDAARIEVVTALQGG